MYNKKQVKFDEVPQIIRELKGISGIYIFHTKGHIWYIGKAECFNNRFTKGYLRYNTTHTHVSKGLKQRMEQGLDLSVVFVQMKKELIVSEEIRIIGKACPWLNVEHNPRESIRAIQRQVGQVVEDSQREWDYKEMIEHIFFYWGGQIASRRIEEALENKNGNLSKYCGTVPSRNTLKPKKKLA